MALNKWIGNAAGNVGRVDHAANWSLGAVPVATNDVEVGPDALAAMSTGLTALAAVAIASFTIKAGRLYDIGTAGQSLQILADRVRVEDTGSSKAYIQVMNGAAVPLLVARTSSSPDALHLKGQYDVAQGIAGGFVTFDAGATIAAGYLQTGGSVAIVAGCTVNGGQVRGGSLTSASNVGAMYPTGGAITLTGSATLGNVTLVAGSHTHNSTGAVGVVDILSGATFDGSGSTGYTANKFRIRANATLVPGIKCTMTNPLEIVQAGAFPSLPAGATVTVTMPA